jgi:NAD(P)H-nitrite reductase large subunit
MSSFLVTKCVCHNKGFDEIREYAKRNGIETVDELRERGVCSTKCKMCVPYIELVLETGDIEFEPGGYYRRKKSS